MPSGIAITAAMKVEVIVRSTVLRKSRPSLPLVIPVHIARKVEIGDGSNTGSTTRAQTVSDQTRSSTATPTNGSNGCRRYIALILCELRVGTRRDNAPWL